MINKEAYIFRFLFIGDGATNYRTPLLNKLVSGKNLSVADLELVDCHGYLADGKKR